MTRRLRRSIQEALARFLHPDFYDDDVQAFRLTRLRERTAGRSMAVVGNAESIFAASFGGAIDRFDLVTRINRGFPRRPTCQGARTDLVCVATKIEAAEFKAEFGAAELIFVSPYRSNMSRSMTENGERLTFYPLSSWRDLSARLGGRRPSAGIMAIDLARRHLNVRSVSLFGFDWKATKTFYRKELHLGVHDWQAESGLIRGWSKEGWLTLPP